MRNEHIVDEADVVVAAPATEMEQPRGGTWYTIRYARKVEKVLHVVGPDGTVET